MNATPHAMRTAQRKMQRANARIWLLFCRYTKQMKRAQRTRARILLLLNKGTALSRPLSESNKTGNGTDG